MRSLIGFCLLAATALPTSAAPEPWALVRADAIRGHVEFLAGDLLEGRAAASRGYDIAAAYVAAQFRQSHLYPAGENETYFQGVPLLEATAVLPGSSAQLVVQDDIHEFEYSTDYLPSADFMSASSTLSAPLTFAGYGVAAPELQYDDFANIDLKGRIAVIFSGAPAQFSNEQRAYYAWSGGKYSRLIERGAVGVVSIDSPVDAKRVPWERSVSMSWVPQMRWVGEDGKPHNAYEQLKLRFRFTHQAAARLFTGAEHDFQEALAAAEAGEAQGFALPGLLTLSATTGLRHTSSMNIIAALPGHDPQLKNEYVIVTAHLDHMGRGAAVNGDAIYNGAHDNALGVAIMLEVARALQASGIRLRRSLLFAAVTAEEKGLLGSDYLVTHPPRQLVANLNTDMPMLFTPTHDLVAFGAEHSTLGASIRTAAAAQGYRLSPDPTPEEVAFIRSDQFSFILEGIPAIVLSAGQNARDARQDAAQLRRDFLQNNYHQPSDDLSLPMDFATAADVARINMRVAVELANATTRPAWSKGSFFARKFGKVAP